MVMLWHFLDPADSLKIFPFSSNVNCSIFDVARTLRVMQWCRLLLEAFFFSCAVSFSSVHQSVPTLFDCGFY